MQQTAVVAVYCQPPGDKSRLDRTVAADAVRVVDPIPVDDRRPGLGDQFVQQGTRLTLTDDEPRPVPVQVLLQGAQAMVQPGPTGTAARIVRIV